MSGLDCCLGSEWRGGGTEICSNTVYSLTYSPPTYSSPIRVCRFMPNFETALRELARVLKPGGLFAATVWGVAERCRFFKITEELALGEIYCLVGRLVACLGCSGATGGWVAGGGWLL